MRRLLELVDRGEADVAFARACTLEKLESRDPAFTSRFRVINEHETPGFYCRHSTALYPNWTIVSTTTATWEASRDVSAALLNMPKLATGDYWAVVSDYSSVDDLYKTLKDGPYRYLRIDSVSGFLWHYRVPVSFILLIILGLALHSWRSAHLVRVRTAELREALARQKVLEAEAAETREQMQAMQHVGMVSAMSSLLAHELNGPLSAISNCCRAMKRIGEEVTLPDVVSRSIDLIERQCRRSSDIVNHVRHYIRSRKTEVTVFDLNDLVIRTVSLFLKAHPKSQVGKVLSDRSVLIRGDRLEVELVISNLLKNAEESVLKTDETPLIRVKVDPDLKPGYVTLTVSDNGPKTTDEALQKFLTPLHTNKVQGLGLGLLIVRTITEKMGGHFLLTAGSTGAVAAVTLPIAEPDLETQKENE